MSDHDSVHEDEQPKRMRRWPLVSLVAVLALGACTPQGCSPPKPPPPKTNACAVDQDATARSMSRRLPAGEAATRAADAFERGAADPEIDDEAGVPLVIVQRDGEDFDYIPVTVDDEAEARDVAERAATSDDVVAVEVDIPVSLVQTAPDDPLYPTVGQWGLHPARTSFLAAAAIADGDDVVVAVLDSGVDSSHPDLAGKVLPGRNYVTSEGHSTNTSDFNGHGTHVAGIVAAVTDNGIGIAGAAPEAKVLPVKVMNEGGTGTISAVVNGMKWARENGADVISMSLGSQKSGLYWPEIVNTWNAGIPMIAAVGNDGAVTKAGYAKGVHCSWPSGYTQVLGVASTSRYGSTVVRSSFSTRGPQVDIGAPGGAICSTVPTWAFVNTSARCTPGQSTHYAILSGTSMAAPFAAGAMAMLIDHCPKPDSASASSFYITRMRKSGHTWPARNIDLGFGRITPVKALSGSCSVA